MSFFLFKSTYVWANSLTSCFCLHRGDTRHPYNKPEITNCARCGCESSQHEVDEGTDARERGNDSFAEGDYRAALIAYSKYVSYFCHLYFAIGNCSPERSSC